jgi:hypothetical protein
MKKNIIIIITVISSILSLVMILFSYFGITRYLSLKINGSESYINNYHKIPKTDNITNIAISTTPDRIINIKPTINSILDQTIRVDKILLIIPQTDIDNGYQLPDYLNQVAILTPTGKNYGEGCCNSIIPMLLHEKECNIIIVALLDDIIYGKDFIETMVSNVETNPGVSLVDKKRTSMVIKPEYYDCSIINRDKDKYTDDWFLTNSKVIDYTENYHI